MKQHVLRQKREELRAERLSRHWSQKKVADQLGVTVVTVNRWEQGVTTPSPYFRLQLCALFQQPAAALGFLPSAPEQPSEIPQESASLLFDPILPSLCNERCPLIGREDILRQIVAQLCNQSHNSYAITGLPGVGKTSLAIALAHDPRIRQRFRDGILWIGLGPTPQLTASMSRLGTLLGLNTSELQALTTPDAWARCLHQHIGNRSLLLILDDAWNLADAVAFHLGGNACVHLLTTRFPHLAHSFAQERVTRLQSLTQEESLRLLQYVVPLTQPKHALELQTLVQAVGGLPLALTLLGRYLSVQSLSGSPDRLTRTLHHLNQDIQARFQLEEPLTSWTYMPSCPAGGAVSLQFAIDMSVHHLPARAQEALRALAIFSPKPFSFSEEAALAVCNTPVEVLDMLVDSGLMELAFSGRYQIHQIIADYARLQGADPKAEKRLVIFIINFVQTHQQDFAALEQDLHTITSTLEIAYTQHMFLSFLQGAAALMPFIEERRLYILAETLLAHAQQASIELADQAYQARTQLWLGKMAELRGERPQARQAYLAGLALARSVEDQDLLVQLLILSGGILIGTEEGDLAEAYIIEGLKNIEQSETSRLAGLAYQYLGQLTDNLGQNDKAISLYQRGLSIAYQTHDWKTASALLQNLGIHAAWRADYPQALTYFRKALTYTQQLNDLERKSALLMNMGLLAWHQHQEEKAIALSLESLRLAREIAHQVLTSSVLQNLGMMMRQRNEDAQAERYLEESLLLARHINHTWLICETNIELGMLLLKQGQYSHARQIFVAMHDQALAISAPFLLARSLFGLAQLAECEGAHIQALTYAQKSLTLFHEAHYIIWSQEVKYWMATLSAPLTSAG